jgi:hypothetical protein
LRFRIGDIVKYTSGDHGNGPSNPLWVDDSSCNIKGEVSYINKFDDFCIGVKWYNGKTNVYRERDLDLLPFLDEELFEI